MASRLTASPRIGRLRIRAALAAILPVLALIAPKATAGDNSRKFPVYRESGGSRDLCLSRKVVHLVPLDSRFAPGKARRIALLEGQSTDPRPLMVHLESLGLWTLPPRPPGVRLLTIPSIDREVLWESFPRCQDADQPEGLSGAPPARSLLEPLPGADDQEAVLEIQRLSRACGGTIATAGLLAVFSYEHLMGQLPARLPVSCEGLSGASGLAPSISSQASSPSERPSSGTIPRGFQAP